ncbi:MAG: hypothetical protein ACLGH0_11360, partial [Thermoanaerobaculia bacterium]
DMAMITAFGDDPFVPGVTPIKAAHVTQLVAAINAFRTAAGLTPLSIANAVPGKVLSVWDVLALRQAINETRVAFGIATHPFADILTAKQTRIKAWHVQEIRELLR